MTEESRFLSFMGMRVHFSVARPEGEIKNRMLFLGSPLDHDLSMAKAAAGTGAAGLPDRLG